jgi:acetyl esterase/lipase
MQFGRRGLVACAAALAGCSPVGLLNDTISERGLVVLHDIPYRTGKLAADPRCALDVYRPADRPGPLPVVVFFYGGSWQSGRRQDYQFVAAPLARRGVVVVVPDYRVYPQVQFPAFLQDAAQAVAFSLRAARSWGGDPHRLFVVGHSAGAYIAVMLALDPHWLQAAGVARDAIAGTVGISGPYDFLPITGPDIRAVFATATADMAGTQPISFADGRNRPLLLLQGLADTTVKPRNTTALAARIRAEGGPVEVRTYPGVGHIGIVIAFAPLFRGDAPTLDDVMRFVTDTMPSGPVFGK